MGRNIPPMVRVTSIPSPPPRPTSPPSPKKRYRSEESQEEKKTVGMDLVTTVGTILILEELLDGPQ